MPIKITNEEFLKRVYSQVGNEYQVCSPYKRANQKVLFKHTTCGNTFEMTPNHFLKDHRRCSYCNHGNAKSPEIFVNEFNKLASNEYTLLSTYRRSNEKIRVKHNKCGYVYMVTPHAFLNGERCPKCFGNHRKSIDQFKKEVLKTTNNHYECLSETYINNRTKVHILHKDCNRDYWVTPHDFVNGNRCPFCQQSKGEKLVASILDQYKVSYEIQKDFEWNKGKHNAPLPFDCYLPDYHLIIEYDGVEHTKPVAYFGGKPKYEQQVANDRLKEARAIDHNLKILRISYTLSFNYVRQHLYQYLCNAEGQEPKVLTMI